ncbi:MAG TPA: cytochrome c oxidase subunit II [Planctomycetaceae bacterium]|nr:cytochrome c oxidase subunit II [Blastopirellula sp.]HAY82708.1 cytochrome c oxidase subunit II [Planctomycetaceae bacterium]
MGRFWSLMFLAVPILGVGCFVWALADLPGMRGHWLPENINDHGHIIDSLFMFILALTGVIFIGTGVALFWFLWKYDSEKNTEPVKYSHGSHALEVVWSILPAATLLFIAIFQMDAWANAKMRRPIASAGPDGIEGTFDDEYLKPIVEVTGRQFEWRIRYAGKDGIIGTRDDIHQVNDLHLPVDEEVVLQIKSMDVLHSFFLPNLRIKQDVVPGMKQYTWFRANRTGIYDIVCAELCGWGHYKMRGQLTVESREDFDAWLEDQWNKQEQSEFLIEEEE